MEILYLFKSVVEKFKKEKDVKGLIKALRREEFGEVFREILKLSTIHDISNQEILQIVEALAIAGYVKDNSII